MSDPARDSPSSASVRLARGASFEGLLVLPGPARIDGRVRGEVMAAADVWVGPDGVVEAHLAGRTVVIEGRVEGDVSATERIELKAGGRVRGRLRAPRLCIADGSVVDGACRTDGASPRAAPTSVSAPGSP